MDNLEVQSLQEIQVWSLKFRRVILKAYSTWQSLLPAKAQAVEEHVPEDQRSPNIHKQNPKQFCFPDREDDETLVAKGSANLNFKLYLKTQNFKHQALSAL